MYGVAYVADCEYAYRCYSLRRRLPTPDLLYIDLTVIVAFLELRGQSQLKLVLTSRRRP